MNRKERLSSCRLYGIADMGYTAEHQLISVTEKLLAGGLGILQLRAKNHDPEHIARMGSRLAPLCREYGCLFIINDYPEIALSTGADGVHLGQDDGELAPVRAMLGANAIIGRSTHSPEQALGAFREQADYIGFINGNTLPSVLEAGASRVVIVSWLLTHPDITETVAALRKRLGEA